jgi:hypothetical protein
MKPTFLLLVLFAVASECFGTVSITATALPNGVVNDSYLGVMTVSGGCTPYSWKVTSGALPSGVTMKTSSSTTSVTLSGKPTTAATYSFTVSATSCGGSVAKASPTIVIQSKSDHVVDLSWNASTSTDVSGYNIYRGPDGKSWRKINASLAASTTYDDSTVADSSTYYYAATAVDIYGNESKKSNIANSTIP